MTTLREAAQLALEALESGVSFKLGWIPDCEDAIIALKAALAEPVPPPEAQTEAEKIAYAAGWWKALEVNREKQAEPVQEPAANEIHGCHGGEGSTLPEQPVQEPHISAPSAQEGKTK